LSLQARFRITTRGFWDCWFANCNNPQVHSIFPSAKSGLSTPRYSVEAESVQRPSAYPNEFQQAFADSLVPKLAAEDAPPVSESQETETWKAFAVWAPVLAPLSVPLSQPIVTPRGFSLLAPDDPTGSDSTGSSAPGGPRQSTFTTGSTPGEASYDRLSPGPISFASHSTRPDADPVGDRPQPATDAGQDVPAGETAFSVRLSSSDSLPDPSPNPVPNTVTISQAAPAPQEPSRAATNSEEDASKPAHDEHSDSRVLARQIPAVSPEISEGVSQIAEATGVLLSTDLSETRTPPSAVRSEAPKPASPHSEPDPAGSATWKTVERLETLAQWKQPSGPVREIIWKAESEGEPGVHLRLFRTANELRATVHSTDSRVTRVLRASVNELLSALRGQGFHAQIEIPENGAVNQAQPRESENQSRRSRRRAPEPASPSKGRPNTAAWMEHWLHSHPHSTD